MILTLVIDKMEGVISLSAEQVQSVLLMEVLIPAMEKGLAEFSKGPDGGIVQPVRTSLTVEKSDGWVPHLMLVLYWLSPKIYLFLALFAFIINSFLSNIKELVRNCGLSIRMGDALLREVITLLIRNLILSFN